MHIRCPHCHNAVEIVDDSSFKDIPCPTCGSCFSLISENETTAAYRGEGTRIAHFSLTEKLGVGAFGTVWKATDTKLDRTVAIKVPRKEQLTEQEMDGFLREARAAGQLRHANIVSVHEVGQDGDIVYIVADYINGVDLKHWLRGQPLPPHESADLCATIAKALHYANEQGVVHRDLKPSNVMMDLNGQPFVMDFGLAKRDSGEITMTVDGAILGTPAYMSPEQARGEAHKADRRSDVYALGVMLFEMLTATHPFQGEKRMLIVQILTEEPPNPRRRNSKVPKDLETICLKCLRKEPKDRYQTAEQLEQDLRRFLAGEPITARPISRLGKAWKWSKRRPMVATLIATLAATVILASIALWEVRNRTYAQGLVDRVLTADIDDVVDVVRELDPYRRIADPLLLAGLNEAQSVGDRRIELRARLALVTVDSTQVDYLKDRLLNAEPEEIETIRALLADYKGEIVDDLWHAAEKDDSDRLLPAASALAVYDPNSEIKWTGVSHRVVETLVKENSIRVAVWIELLRPVRRFLVESLEDVYRSKGVVRSQSEVDLATDLLEQYVKDDVETLTGLLLDAGPDQFTALFDEFAMHGEKAVARLNEELNASKEESKRDPNRRANAAIALLKMGDNETLWSLLERSPNETVRSLLIHRLKPLQVDMEVILDRLSIESDAGIRQALLLSLGEFDKDQLNTEAAPKMIEELLTVYKEDADPGVHSAAEWLLQRLGHGKSLDETDQTISINDSSMLTRSDREKGDWYVNSQGHTMVAVTASEFTMGSPVTENYHFEDEAKHVRRIARSFAVSTKETSVEQFERFNSKDPGASRQSSRESTLPVIRKNWFAATAYCNWLSEQEGVPKEEWCYLPRPDGQYAQGMKVAPDYLAKSGYRLPSEAEWELVCRAGTQTTWHCGEFEELLPNYGWYFSNSDGRLHPLAALKPNNFGMFDMHGNAYEWCHDPYNGYLQKLVGDKSHALDTPHVESAITNERGRVLRGGSFDSHPKHVRSADRQQYPPRYSVDLVPGFRVARTLPIEDRTVARSKNNVGQESK